MTTSPEVIEDASATSDSASPVPSATLGGENKSKKRNSCHLIQTHELHTGAYRFAYTGFTLLVRSGGNYFLTATPEKPRTPWRPAFNPVFVIPDTSDIRVELTRGVDYVVNPGETTASGTLPFTC